jgi:hypothetical protein
MATHDNERHHLAHCAGESIGVTWLTYFAPWQQYIP